MKNAAKYAFIITFIWTGMVLGISFLEAPLKFQAPDISLALGLGIGRLVFAALNKFEVLFMIITALAAWRGNYTFIMKVLVALLAVILSVQTLYLLPFLDVRAGQIIAGISPPNTPHHLVYIFMEIAKLVLLIWLGLKQVKILELKPN